MSTPICPPEVPTRVYTITFRDLTCEDFDAECTDTYNTGTECNMMSYRDCVAKIADCGVGTHQVYCIPLGQSTTHYPMYRECNPEGGVYKPCGPENAVPMPTPIDPNPGGGTGTWPKI